MFAIIGRVIAVLMGSVVTIGLFGLMIVMIFGTERKLDEGDPISIADFVRLKRDEVVEKKERPIPDKPPPPEKPPPPPSMEVESMDAPTPPPLDISFNNLNVAAGGLGPGMGAFIGRQGDSGVQNRGLVPRQIVQPQYPQRALMDGLEGTVTFTITIDAEGNVVKATLTDFSNRMFIRPAQRVIYRWKFFPMIVNGEAQATTQTYVMEFNME